MIKKVITFGDSFTYGEELPDLYQAWPYRLGDLVKCEIVNCGLPAASNDKILRLIMESFVTEPDSDLYIIGWTSPGRSEHADEFGYYDVWPGYQGNLFKNNDTTWRNNLVDYVSRYHNAMSLHKKFIHQVLLIQEFLKSHGKDYIMMNVGQNDYYKKITVPDYNRYLELIDASRFMGLDKSGMLEWTYGCEKGPNGHFLADGHRIVAEKIYDYIRHLGWLS